MTDLSPILKTLSAASAKQPLSIEALRKVADREGIDVAELYTLTAIASSAARK